MSETIQTAEPFKSPTDAAAISARGIGKEYRLGEREGLMGLAGRILNRYRPSQQLSALSDVSFDMRSGECFGVVGRNGSGKSTLMQMIAGITLPTAGEMTVHGLVMPLLSVGTVFHPELTGRENVELFGTILGFPRRTIHERMDAIIRFAGLERHQDTPNKRYSDGMQARLSFAVGMLLPADIYLFDEVLSVVDGGFRAQCTEQLRALIEAGKSIVFVSHDLDQVERLCDRAMWLRSGRVESIGPTGQVLAGYRAAL
jgi:ABC-type polysaccharide/polyol phosphate transport system ATPase subunit